MRSSFRLTALAAAGAATLTAALILGTAAPATALAITAPLSTNLGSGPVGSTNISAQLGLVTATGTGIIPPNFKATVSATVFKTGAGGIDETIGKTSILYWSGPATLTTGVSVTPGQPSAADAVDLSVSRTAFTGKGLALTITAAWNPTLIVNIPANAVAGAYTGTITHSIA